MDPVKYAVLTTNAVYVVLINPGDNPVQAVGTTQPQITDANRAHLANKCIYHTYLDTDLALTNQLLAKCPDLFTEAQKEPHVGYCARTTLNLLTHLWVTYSKIEPSLLVKNEKRIKAAWHPTKPIEKLFNQLKFATAGNAGYTEITIVRAGYYHIISDTGLFKHDLKEWHGKPEAQWTMAIFTAFFKAANIDHLATTTDGGFHSANLATETHLAAASNLFDLVAAHMKIAHLEKLLATNKPPAKPTVPGTVPCPVATTYCWMHGTSKLSSHPCHVQSQEPWTFVCACSCS